MYDRYPYPLALSLLCIRKTSVCISCHCLPEIPINISIGAWCDEHKLNSYCLNALLTSATALYTRFNSCRILFVVQSCRLPLYFCFLQSWLPTEELMKSHWPTISITYGIIPKRYISLCNRWTTDFTVKLFLVLISKVMSGYSWITIEKIYLLDTFQK